MKIWTCFFYEIIRKCNFFYDIKCVVINFKGCKSPIPVYKQQSQWSIGINALKGLTHQHTVKECLWHQSLQEILDKR